MKKFLVFTFLFLCVIFWIFPLGVVPSGATGEGIEGFFYNPASLGFNENNAISIDVGYVNRENYTTSLFWGNNLGIVYTLDSESPFYTFLVGAGLPVLPNLYVGYDLSVDYFAGSWKSPVCNLGVLGVPLDGLTVGVYQRDVMGMVGSSLNLSIGLRPLYLLNSSVGTRLSLFADVSLPVNYSDMGGTISEFFGKIPDNFSYSIGVSLDPVDGINLGARLNNWKSFETGIGISTGITNFYFSFNSDFGFSDCTFNAGIRLKEKPDRTIFRPPRESYIVKFSHYFDASSVDRYSVYNIDSFVSRVYQLADDPGCKTLYVVFDHPVVGSVGNLEEIKNAYSYFTEKGKKIVTYINNSFSQLDYLAAACGTRIIIPPTGFIFLSGVGAEFLFFKTLFDREGVEVEYSRSSNYKSALDTFIKKKLSKENREQYTAYLKTIYRLFKEILKRRSFDDKRVVEIIDNGPYDANAAKEIGLVDKLMYYDDFENTYVEKNSPAGLKIVEYARKRWKAEPVVAVFKLSGPVVNSAGISPISYLLGGSYITEKNTIPFIKMVGEDSRIKALIVQIDSPGGDGTISDEIWNALVKLREKKPVVVVMGSVAASGGYYIAMAGDYIIAKKTTLTGSIGAFSYKYVIKKLLEKHGVATDSVSFGKNYNMFSPFDELTEEQREKMKSMTDFFVKQFYTKVAKARGLSLKRVEEIGGGRIYSGDDALRLKLIDRIGGLRDAFDYVEKKLNLAKGSYRVEYYPDERALMRLFVEELEESEITTGDVFKSLMMRSLLLRP